MEYLRKAGPWLFAGIASLCVLLGISTYLSFTAFHEFEQERMRARAANEVLTTVRELWVKIQEAETGQWGYILTERPSYLDPYLAAVDRIPALQKRLQSLVGNDSELLQQTLRLHGDIDRKIKELKTTIDLSRTAGFAEARKLIAIDVGKDAMDEIRTQIHSLTERQESALVKHRIEADRKESLARNATLPASVLGFFLATAGGLVFARNYGRLKAAEANLKEEASVLQASLDNTGEGVAVFDPTRGLVAWNPRFFLFADFPDDLPKAGRPFDDFLDFDQKRQAQVFEIGDDNLGIAAMEQRYRIRQRVKVGARELECSQRRTQTGSIVMTCSDITERLQAEQVVRQAQKMEAIGHLTGGVAHDFNNLLQVIASNLDLISKHRDDSKFIATHLEYANQAATRGAQLTRQLLAFARKQPLEPVIGNLGRRVRAMSNLLHRTLGETIQIETIVDAGLWNTFVDINQVENAVLNLAVNARDAMPSGGKLTIELANAVLDENYARAHDEVASGQYVMLAVTDTGAGMPAEVAARAFDPFYTTKSDGQGTGLGLSMVYGFVKQSSGHIKIYSEVGHGTTIKIYLPRSRRPEETEASANDTEIQGGRERILLVEDDEDVRRAVADMTRGLGYHVTEARDGEHALSMLRAGLQVDLLFTDVVMSGAVSGRVLANRARELLSPLAVLFTSGYTENAIIHYGRLDEGLHLLSKPYGEAELSRKLRAVLDKRQQSHGKAGPQKAAEDSANGRSPVLLVDDDALIRMSTAQMLQELGHRVRDATLAGDALAILRGDPGIDVLIVDLTLPDMNGVDMVKQASTFRSDLRVLFATGHNASMIDLDLSKINYVVLSKPYDTQQLAAALGKLGV